MSRPRHLQVVPTMTADAAKDRWPQASADQRLDLRAYAASTSLEAADRQYTALLAAKERRRQERAARDHP